MPLIVPGSVQLANNKTEQWTKLLMGKKIHAEKHDDVHFSKQELPKNSRVIEDGHMYTADFQENRLNVHLDKDGTVKKVNYG